MPNYNEYSYVFPELKHSKVPWKMCGEERNGCVCGQVWSNADSCLAEPVATCHGTKCRSAEYQDVPNPDDEEQQANMALIAASPELYDICRELYINFNNCSGSVFDNWLETDGVNRLEAALKKASGIK